MAPLSGERCSVNACGMGPSCVAKLVMDEAGLSAALERAERALERIEHSLSSRQQQSSGRDEQLRSRVREAVAELDQLIRASGS